MTIRIIFNSNGKTLTFTTNEYKEVEKFIIFKELSTGNEIKLNIDFVLQIHKTNDKH